jgi:hypothetical protein
MPEVAKEVSRECPRCGETAAIHGRMTRAIHDWEVTFVECARLRCCGQTFTAAPPGLTPRARYSDRVVRLARALVAMNVSVRECVRILRQAGVVVTPQTVHQWSRSVRRQARARARVVGAPEGRVCVRLRSDLWLALETRAPKQVESILSEAIQ